MFKHGTRTAEKMYRLDLCLALKAPGEGKNLFVTPAIWYVLKYQKDHRPCLTKNLLVSSSAYSCLVSVKKVGEDAIKIYRYVGMWFI